MPPFAAVQLPSLGLAQLQARLVAELGDLVQVEVLYLNHDFARFVGADRYQALAYSTAVYHTGFGEWLFRQVAFPDAPDNREAYFRRYFRSPSRERDLALQLTDELRDRLGAFLDETIAAYALDRADLV